MWFVSMEATLRVNKTAIFTYPNSCTLPAVILNWIRSDKTDCREYNKIMITANSKHHSNYIESINNVS
jgi:hypothetical protein